MGDDINTDDIVPSRVLTLRDEYKMAQCTFENIDPHFIQKVGKLKILISGENFGCGSSREEAVNVLNILGIKGIIAKSFGRIFFRNLINQGVPGIVLNWSKNDFSNGDHIKIFLNEGKIQNLTKNKVIKFKKSKKF